MIIDLKYIKWNQMSTSSKSVGRFNGKPSSSMIIVCLSSWETSDDLNNSSTLFSSTFWHEIMSSWLAFIVSKIRNILLSDADTIKTERK